MAERLPKIIDTPKLIKWWTLWFLFRIMERNLVCVCVRCFWAVLVVFVDIQLSTNQQTARATVDQPNLFNLSATRIIYFISFRLRFFLFYLSRMFVLFFFSFLFVRLCTTLSHTCTTIVDFIWLKRQYGTEFETKSFPHNCDCSFHLVCVACVHIFIHRYSIDERNNWTVTAYSFFLFRFKRNTHYSTTAKHITTTRNQFPFLPFSACLLVPISLGVCMWALTRKICMVNQQIGACIRMYGCECLDVYVPTVWWKQSSNDISSSFGSSVILLSFALPFHLFLFHSIARKTF